MGRPVQRPPGMTIFPADAPGGPSADRGFGSPSALRWRRVKAFGSGEETGGTGTGATSGAGDGDVDGVPTALATRRRADGGDGAPTAW